MTSLFASLHSFDAALAERLMIADEARIPCSFWALISFTMKTPFLFSLLALLFLVSGTEVKAVVLLIVIGDIISYLSFYLLKRLVRRSRPMGTFNAHSRRMDPYSFPSGHATRSASLATLMFYLTPPAYALPAVLWSLLVGISRVRIRMHYPLDVLAGWSMGAVIGVAVNVLLTG